MKSYVKVFYVIPPLLVLFFLALLYTLDLTSLWQSFDKYHVSITFTSQKISLSYGSVDVAEANHSTPMFTATTVQEKSRTLSERIASVEYTSLVSAASGRIDFSNITKKLQVTTTGEILRSTAAVTAASTNESLSDTLACMIPRLDPFDPQIAPYISHPSGISCSKSQSEHLVILNDYGYLKLSEAAMTKDVKCKYRFCHSHFPGENDKIEFTDYKDLAIDENVAMQEDCAEVRCQRAGKDVYHFIYTYPSNNSIAQHEIEPTNETQLSLMIFVMDSLSTSAVKRNLPKLHSYLTNIMGSKLLEGYAKVGDNSFPNFIPAMTGKRVNSLEGAGNMPPEMPTDSKGGYNVFFDEWNLIWKEFAKRGYAIGYLEDIPKYGLFHYTSKGFQQKPVDHFYYPAWNLLYNGVAKSSWHCTGNEPTLKVFLDQITRHIKRYKGMRYYLQPYFMELQHDVDNEVERGQDELLRFFKDSFDNNLFNDTVVIFMSDHGIRFGTIRTTDVGRIEETLPYFSIYFPQWFYKLYPHIERNLDINHYRLSSHFDTHALLLDIAYGAYETQQRPLNSRELSPLYIIPPNRTCVEAGVPTQYCPCLVRRAADVHDPVVKSAADHTVKYINDNLLKNHRNICHELRLDEVLKAHIMDTSIGAKKHVDYQMAIKTAPNNATFESHVRYTPSSKDLQLIGEISRTNVDFGQMLHLFALWWNVSVRDGIEVKIFFAAH